MIPLYQSIVFLQSFELEWRNMQLQDDDANCVSTFSMMQTKSYPSALHVHHGYDAPDTACRIVVRRSTCIIS